jgi:hypothetical protein
MNVTYKTQTDSTRRTTIRVTNCLEKKDLNNDNEKNNRKIKRTKQ